MVNQFKAYIIAEELQKYKGNICRTATAFGLHRNSLSRYIEALNVNRVNGNGGNKQVHMLTNGAAVGARGISVNQCATQGVQSDAETEVQSVPAKSFS